MCDYLKDPLLVVRVQNFFGVKKKNRRNQHCEDVDKKLENAKSPARFKKEKGNHEIGNYFWYYLFTFGTLLGDEIFYSTFIPFLFWNIDPNVGRRVVFVWATVMSIGQMLKDVIRWPRPPCPPVVRFDDKWILEYGMPSTHAMIGVAIPFSLLLFTKNIYIYPFFIGCAVAILWCALVCVSRIYLGMHTVLDVIVGLALAIALMTLLVPVAVLVDNLVLANDYALFTLIVISILVIVCYPSSGDKWTPTRGDTAMVMSVASGIYFGTRLLGNNLEPAAATFAAREIFWPGRSTFWRLVLRTSLGYCCVFATKAIVKILTYRIAAAMLKKELVKCEFSYQNRDKILVDLVYKFVSCFFIGLDISYVLPNFFQAIGIENVTFHRAL